MKQGWKAPEEASRQEGEKPWSRKVSGEANPREPGFRSSNAGGEQTPREPATLIEGGSQVRSYSGGESKLLGGLAIGLQTPDCRVRVREDLKADGGTA